MNAEYTGKQIAELRKVKNFTQKELADKLHVTDKAVSKWERGINFPDLGLMENLAEALDTTPSYLLGLENVSKEEIVNSITEISNKQKEQAYNDIQTIGWINLITGVFLIIFMYFINIKLQRTGLFFESQTLLWGIYGLIAVVSVGAVYTLKKYKAIRKWKTLDVVLTEVLVFDAAVFLGIQLFTERNPNYFWTLILFAVGSICLQVLFYRIMKPQMIKAVPMISAILLACWGVLLYFTSPSWENAELGDLLVHYVSPAVFCFVTWLICRKRDAAFHTHATHSAVRRGKNW